MPGAPQVIRQTPEEFARLVREFGERLEGDPAFTSLMAVVCGGFEQVQAFARPAGVGMSRFAALVDLPASTVRHYQRLGLVTPYEVGGKFRFWVHNVIQVESVKQWRDLGLSLEDILSQRSPERLGGQTLTFNAPMNRGVSALVTEKALHIEMLARGNAAASPTNALNPATLWMPLREERVRMSPGSVFRPGGTGTGERMPDSRRLLGEIRAARLRLEQQLHILQLRVQQARRLEAALEHEQQGDPQQER